jgi:hypothetical protein
MSGKARMKSKIDKITSRNNSQHLRGRDDEEDFSLTWVRTFYQNLPQWELAMSPPSHPGPASCGGGGSRD